jgi:DNA-binding CsgD family transcriptional regulator
VLVAVGAAATVRAAAGGGRVLHEDPDRTVVVFDSVRVAVAAARRIVAGAPAGTSPPPSVGLAVGELAVDGDRWSGPGREVAEALAERARRRGGPTIVATATVAALAPADATAGAAAGADDLGGGRWEPTDAATVGAAGIVDCVELVGLAGPGPGPRPGVAGAGEPPEPLGPLDVALPAVLALDTAFPFVGRDEAWASLTEAWTSTASTASSASGTPGRRVVLVGGEAGSGKTRLVTELSRWVHARGGAVMYGACSEQPTLPYEPFARAIDQLVATVDAATRAWLLRDREGALGRLLPRLGTPAPTEPAGVRAVGRATERAGEPAGVRATEAAGDLAAERFRLFDAVATLLATLAARRPLLLVLDDLQWARRPTVELLDHLVRSPATAPVCVVATYRSTSADVGDDFKAALPDLRRHPSVSRLVIGGFDRDGVERFVAGAAGHDPGPGLAPAVALLGEQTGGNAFLLGELWRHLVDAGHLVRAGGRWRVAGPVEQLASPEGVREVVAARLDRLPDETRAVLHRAAVIGTRFSIPVLAAAAGTDVRTVLAHLDPAVRAHVVEEEGTGHHRFVHALVRLAVIGGLAAGERRSHHLDVAEALERVEGDRAVADVAFHTSAAVPLAEPQRAVDAGRRAAAAARHAVANDDAARLLEAVLDLVPPGRQRAELLLELADARMRAGDVAAAQSRCLEANDLARSVDAPDLVVAAALAYDDANWRAALDGTVAADLLREALPLATEPDRALQLQAALGRALAFSGQGAEAEAMAQTTIAAARELGDPSTLQIAYAAALFSPWTPANLDELRLYARDLVDVARSEHNLEWELSGLDKLLFAAVVAGDLDEARAIAARHRTLTARLGQPLFRVLDLQAHALLAVGEGRFTDAESLAEEADSLASFLSGNDVAGGYGVQMFSIRREQGRLDEARPLAEAVARFGQAGATWRPALAALYAELGLLDAAADELRFLVADGLAAVPRDSLWWASLSYLTDAAVALGDRAAAEAVHRELAPARGLVVQVGNLLAAYGAVDRYLGALCGLLGRTRDAEAHFETAMRIDRRARMPVWLARTQVAYARFLVDRAAVGGADDLDRATAMLRAAADAAERCGMRRVAAEAGELLERASGAVARRPAGAPGSAALGPEHGGEPGHGPARPGTGLTPRELAILPLVAAGCTNREIGSRLHISQHTAANHIRSILLKTGCANRTEAAAWALRQGLVGD